LFQNLLIDTVLLQALNSTTKRYKKIGDLNMRRIWTEIIFWDQVLLGRLIVA